MYTSKINKSQLLKQYALKAYVDQVNPEFFQMSKKYINKKKQKQRISKEKNLILHQVRSIQKINARLDKIIIKKKQQLQRSRQIRNRYIQDKKQKKNRQIQKQKQLELKKLHSLQQKMKISEGTYRAKIEYDMIRKQIANMTKQEKRILKTQKIKTQIDQWTKSRIKVQKIEEDKSRGVQSRNHFFKSRNSSFLLRYKTELQKQTQFIQNEKHKISSLSLKRQNLSRSSEIRKNALHQLNRSILQNKKKFKQAQKSEFQPQNKKSSLKTQLYSTNKSSSDSLNN